MAVAGLLCASLVWIGFQTQAWGEVRQIVVDDLSAFRNPPSSWQVVGDVTASLDEDRAIEVTSGSGIIVNFPSDSVPGLDIFTAFEHGDIDLELEYLMPRHSNSGIYLQGRYELQLFDSWGRTEVAFLDNGAIYERWDYGRPQGQEGFDGVPPLQDASRAPGLWQHLRLSFRAPRFNEEGEKTENARIGRAELNGALIHEDVELSGPTRGTISEEEAAKGPLRIQGDHGPVAFRNIRITSYEEGRPDTDPGDRRDLILVDTETTPVLRSFMDIPGGPRVTHAISVASPANVHYTYDMEHGSLVQVWRGDFLDATPMWRSRGDGTSRPLGAVQYLTRRPELEVTRLSSLDQRWNGDADSAGFRQRGYRLDAENRPTFMYEAHDAAFEDAVRVLDGGRGVERVLRVSSDNGAGGGLYARLAVADSIRELSPGLFLVGDKTHYIRLDDKGAGALVRESDGRQELIVPMEERIVYSVLF